MLLLADDKFMPEIHVKNLKFTYSSCEPFSKWSLMNADVKTSTYIYFSANNGKDPKLKVKDWLVTM